MHLFLLVTLINQTVWHAVFVLQVSFSMLEMNHLISTLIEFLAHHLITKHAKL